MAEDFIVAAHKHYNIHPGCFAPAIVAHGRVLNYGVLVDRGEYAILKSRWVPVLAN